MVIDFGNSDTHEIREEHLKAVQALDESTVKAIAHAEWLDDHSARLIFDREDL